MKQRSEIEVKYRLGRELTREQVATRLLECGFERKSSQLEFDFVPDTDGYRCRANKAMVRFRRVTDAKGSRTLMTFKAKQKEGRYLDHLESEFYLDRPDAETWEHINKLLSERVGLTLPDEILGLSDYVRAIELAAKAGLDHFRIMIEKRRETFERGNLVATVDELPQGIGEFMELEAHSEEELEALVKELDLPVVPEKLDYGHIVIDHNGSEDTRGRTAVFDEATRDAILGLVKEHVR